MGGGWGGAAARGARGQGVKLCSPGWRRCFAKLGLSPGCSSPTAGHARGRRTVCPTREQPMDLACERVELV